MDCVTAIINARTHRRMHNVPDEEVLAELVVSIVVREPGCEEEKEDSDAVVRHHCHKLIQRCLNFNQHRC
jgi:hypothetical protein